MAVLPFDNLTGNPSDQYLSDGMTEEVIGQLAQVKNLKVISRTSTEALKGARLTLRQIADTLGVRHILEGSVRHEGDRIRVNVDLIDANTDTHIWRSRYDRDFKSMFAAQEEKGPGQPVKIFTAHPFAQFDCPTPPSIMANPMVVWNGM